MRLRNFALTNNEFCDIQPQEVADQRSKNRKYILEKYQEGQSNQLTFH